MYIADCNNPPKRTKIDNASMYAASHDNCLPKGLKSCVVLLDTSPSVPTPVLPESILQNGKILNDLNKLKAVFDQHGFRTTVVTSPRAAVSIYKDSCHLNDEIKTHSTSVDGIIGKHVEASIENSEVEGKCQKGKAFLLSMLGLHPVQDEIEHWYSTSVKALYCLSRFCHRMREACPTVCQDQMDTLGTLQKCEELCREIYSKSSLLLSSNANPAAIAEMIDHMHHFSSSVPEKIAELMDFIIKRDPRVRIEQLEKEYERINVNNSTFANALVQLFVGAHDCCIKDVYFKRSHLQKFERISIYLYDPDMDMMKPPSFTFLPCLRRVLDCGPEAVALDMIKTFWSNLLRLGYFATESIQADFTPQVRSFFLSGIADNVNIPILLNAHFTPKMPLSFYLYGLAGAGKSSFVRNFSPALNCAIEEHADPEILVRYVKQNLNKPNHVLKLELELRPNNNDLSVMSIIQGRRLTLTQSKPGMVVVGLEEIASNGNDADPNQLETCKLISQRFAGRTGIYRNEVKAPRNAAKRGISGDASVVVLFTSNYELEKPCMDALKRLEMFQNLMCVRTTAVSGDDRVDFAKTYITQCIQDNFADVKPLCEIDLKSYPVGSGDTRPLVRHLRMLAFYICFLAKNRQGGVYVGSSIIANIAHDNSSYITSVLLEGEQQSIKLNLGSFNNLYPLSPRVFDSRAGCILKELQHCVGESEDQSSFDELSQIIDYYFAGTLAPAVVVSNNRSLIREIVAAVGKQESVHSINGVDADNYKMMKSLYDPNDTPNLRDDILKFGKGANVAVELICNTANSQLCIREIIEDSPSMTAFSTNKSALHKTGLFFGVFFQGPLTPEVRSRASIVL
mmetsp:Transcript_7644/g.11115  ORF Transcript_7644/g.11115 Transcript_7644/m.11115 type:complete len:851 (-) Transcript_7644:515-3067(-)